MFLFISDIVLAMQLSAMCFGALFALCVVACCAYKICGPAEEEDFSRRYRYTTLKTRLPPELLREIYTLPASTVVPPPTTQEENPIIPPPPPVTQTQSRPSLCSSQPNLSGNSLFGNNMNSGLGGGMGLGAADHKMLSSHLQNGRAIPPEDSQSGCGLALGYVLDNRPRVLTISSLSSSRLLTEARRPGVAPRLAAHLNNSTLDLTSPQGGFPPERSLSEPHTAIV